MRGDIFTIRFWFLRRVPGAGYEGTHFMKVDYLIVGAGAVGLAFLDVMLAESDATVAIVDRRDAPGGHWNDAYPFVRLHQSSFFYGVPSRQLGQYRLSDRGYNAGMFELAGKQEILHYYLDLMETVYLPSGRVQYFPMSEYRDGVVRSLVSGQETQIEIGRKRVNAGIWGDLTTIPLTHERSFEVAEGVTCLPPNDLPRRTPSFDRFTVIGAGKTAMDSVLWLLEKGTSPDQIDWVRPTDYWLFCRETILPHQDFFFETMNSTEAEFESLANATTVQAHCAAMEACEKWHRIDTSVWPGRFHAAVCSRAEVEALRRISNVIRKGHVKRIEADRMLLEEGEVAVDPGRLFIDCTAHGGATLDATDRRVFDDDVINLFMIRPFQPLFSAALIAHMEAIGLDDATRQACTAITNFHDTPAEYLAVQRTGFINQGAWNQIPEIKDWVDGCSLNASRHLLAGISEADQDKLALLGRLGPLTRAAIGNIPKILASEPA